MLHFHPLTVREIRRETDDCVSIVFDPPAEFVDEYRYIQGQHLNFKVLLDGEDVRRSYSICSSVGENELRVAIKKVDGGVFSTFANERLRVGDTLEVMAPAGRFNTPVDPDHENTYVAFAAGSGITPVSSIIKTTLETEPNGRFVLFYGNRNRDSIIFREQFEDLKNRFMDRFSLHHILSREAQEIELYNGRLDTEKVQLLGRSVFRPEAITQFYVCGPSTMIEDVAAGLNQFGVDDDRIHFERFVTGPLPDAEHVKKQAVEVEGHEQQSRVTVILDGRRTEFGMDYNADSILDAAIERGFDLPFSCKGGVCSTCRTKLVEGKVDMEVNYALEPHEVDAGYVLACQSRPLTDKVVVDFDAP